MTPDVFFDENGKYIPLNDLEAFDQESPGWRFVYDLLARSDVLGIGTTRQLTVMNGGRRLCREILKDDNWTDIDVLKHADEMAGHNDSMLTPILFYMHGVFITCSMYDKDYCHLFEKLKMKFDLKIPKWCWEAWEKHTEPFYREFMEELIEVWADYTTIDCVDSQEWEDFIEDIRKGVYTMECEYETKTHPLDSNSSGSHYLPDLLRAGTVWEQKEKEARENMQRLEQEEVKEQEEPEADLSATCPEPNDDVVVPENYKDELKEEEPEKIQRQPEISYADLLDLLNDVELTEENIEKIKKATIKPEEIQWVLNGLSTIHKNDFNFFSDSIQWGVFHYVLYACCGWLQTKTGKKGLKAQLQDYNLGTLPEIKDDVCLKFSFPKKRELPQWCHMEEKELQAVERKKKVVQNTIKLLLCVLKNREKNN